MVREYVYATCDGHFWADGYPVALANTPMMNLP